MAKRPPNILVVLTDEQRRDTLGCYGNPLCATPALDALAAGGMRFDECVVQHPLCMPSRATIMTGQYPSGHGVRANGVNLAPEVPLLTTTLKEAGYRTASFGKIHLNAWGGEHDAAASHENQAALATRRTVPPGYMGFDTAEVVGGHNETVYGPDYTDWLAERCPDGYGLMQIEHALDEPSGAWRTWNSACRPSCTAPTGSSTGPSPTCARPTTVRSWCSARYRTRTHRSVRRLRTAIGIGRRRCRRRRGGTASWI